MGKKLEELKKRVRIVEEIAGVCTCGEYQDINCPKHQPRHRSATSKIVSEPAPEPKREKTPIERLKFQMKECGLSDKSIESMFEDFTTYYRTDLEKKPKCSCGKNIEGELKSGVNLFCPLHGMLSQKNWKELHKEQYETYRRFIKDPDPVLPLRAQVAKLVGRAVRYGLDGLWQIWDGTTWCIFTEDDVTVEWAMGALEEFKKTHSLFVSMSKMTTSGEWRVFFSETDQAEEGGRESYSYSKLLPEAICKAIVKHAEEKQ